MKKRVCALLLTLVMVLGLFPVQAFAATEPASGPVTAYLSISDDAGFMEDSQKKPVALRELTVPYFDLKNYGLENFYFQSESYQPGDLTPENADPAAFRLTVTGTDPIPTTVEVTGETNFDRPLAGTTAQKAYTAVVKDQYGKPMTGVPVTWDLTGNAGGYGFDISESGVLTVQPDASGDGITVTATAGGVTGKLKVSLNTEASKPTVMNAYFSDGKETSKTVNADPAKSTDYKVKVQVINQYGMGMGPGINCTLTYAYEKTGVAPEFNEETKKFTVAANQRSGSNAVTITATGGGASVSKTVTLTVTNSSELDHIQLPGNLFCTIKPNASSTLNLSEQVQYFTASNTALTPGSDITTAYELTGSVPAGVEIGASTGILLVPKMLENADVTVKVTATQGGEGHTCTGTVHLRREESRLSDITVSGDTILDRPLAGKTLTVTYTAEVYDQYHAVMPDVPVIWTLVHDGNVPAELSGWSLSANGVLTVQPDAAEIDSRGLWVCGAVSTAPDSPSHSRSLTLNTEDRVAASVSAPAGSISIKIPSKGSTTATYTAKVYDQYGAVMPGVQPTWSTSDENYTISSAGVLTVTSTSPKNTDLYIYAQPGTLTEAQKSIKVSVAEKPLPFVSFESAALTKTYGDPPFTQDFTITPADAPISYRSSNPEILSVNAVTGEVTILKAGSAKVYMDIAETEDYQASYAAYDVTVLAPNLTITVMNKTCKVGDPAPSLANPQAGTDYCVTGLKNDDSVDDVVLDYVDTPDTSAPGKYQITVTSHGDSIVGRYNITYVNGTLTINAKDTQADFGFAENALTKTYGDAAFTQKATGAVSGSTVTYAVTSGSDVASVDPATGKITILKPGTATITATASETADYNEAQSNLVLTVQKAALTISAVNKTSYVGKDAPSLAAPQSGKDYKVSGLKNGDTVTGVKLSYASTPDTSKVGTFVITVQSYDNAAAIKEKYDVTLESGTLSVANKPSGGGSSSSGSSAVDRETAKNPDGSTTVTETKKDGTTVETTTRPNGNKTVVENKKDGSTVTTETNKAGDKSVTETDKHGNSTTEVKQADGTTAKSSTNAKGETQAEVKLSGKAVQNAEKADKPAVLPIPPVEAQPTTEDAPVVKITTDSKTPVRVEIPVSNMTPGTVPVIVAADGTERVVPQSALTETGVVLSVEDGTTVKLVDAAKEFQDIPEAFWAADAVAFVSARELFNGTAPGTFTPNAPTSRGQLMTVLARLAGADTTGNPIRKGMEWAMESGISDGTNPQGTMSRQQLATMLWRLAGQPESSFSLTNTDKGTIASYAETAMAWAVENGVMGGYADGSLKPENTASRAHVAAMVSRYINR